MITVADILALPAFARFELLAPVEGALTRPVRNIGIMDATPGPDAYADYLPGEFIITNLGFVREDPEGAERSLCTMLARDLAGLAVKSSYGVAIPASALEASQASGTPLFSYEGGYYEEVAFQGLSLIHRDRRESDRGHAVDGLLAVHDPEAVRAALYRIAGAVGSTVQCAAVEPPTNDECSLYAVLDTLEREIEGLRRSWANVEAACACRYHGALLVIVSRSIGSKALEDAALVAGRDISASEADMLARIESVGGLSCGIGEELPLSDGDLAVREALAALEVARGRGSATVRWADLRRDAFAAAARADRLQARAAAAHRGRLEACDVDSGADLERTARAFADACGDIRVAAEALCQHPNTVRYRLRKIKAALDMPDASDRELAQLLGFVFLAE